MRKKLLFPVISIILIFLLGSGFYIYQSFAAVPKMFRLNEKLKAEGYYMGEFEFKMLGLVHYLDKGQYITAFSRLNQLHKQLKSKVGLIKVPKFADKKEELEFYLGLQNPRTGAFMDDDYPFITYYEPTMNVLDKLEGLAKETGQPLKLKYPLKFLDQLSTWEKLKPYLDDLSSVGWIASKLPKTPFILAAKMTSYHELETKNLYTFSPEWKQALKKWFYENQDSKTGFWGSRLRGTGELLNSGDLGPTMSIVEHLFLDDLGKTLHPEFPLRYKEEMFSTVLNKLAEPMPEDADLAEIHDWQITRYQGIKFLTNFLWQTASTQNKNLSKKLIEDIVRTKFEKCYVNNRGGFSLYPGATEPDLDGTGGMLGLLKIIGAYKRDRQELLWGPLEKKIIDLGVHKVSELKEGDFTSILSSEGINSIRIYRADPGSDSYLSNVVGIIYPKEMSVLDVTDLLPKLTHWVNTTSQTMGNWTPKEWIQQELANLKIQPVLVAKGDIPLKLMNEFLKNNEELVVIGFDELQIPRYKMVFHLN